MDLGAAAEGAGLVVTAMRLVVVVGCSFILALFALVLLALGSYQVKTTLLQLLVIVLAILLGGYVLHDGSLAKELFALRLPQLLFFAGLACAIGSSVYGIRQAGRPRWSLREAIVATLIIAGCLALLMLVDPQLGGFLAH